jgi:hypothetical protein
MSLGANGQGSNQRSDDGQTIMTGIHRAPEPGLTCDFEWS